MISALKCLVHQQFRPLRYRLLESLLAHETLIPEQLQHYQQQQFNAMVRFALEQTDFYRESYQGLTGPEFD